MAFDLESALLSDAPLAEDDVETTEVEDSLNDTLTKRPNLDLETGDEDGESEVGDVEDPLVSAANADDEPQPEAAAEVEKPAPVPTSQQQEPEPFEEAFFELAAKSGLDLRGKYKTAADAVNGLTNAARLVGQRNELAEVGRMLQEDPKAVYERLKSAFEPKPAEATVAAPATPDGQPEWKDEWRDLFDADGKPVPGADPSILKKVAKYQSWMQEEQLALIRDPLGKLLPKLQPQIEKLAQQKAEELLTARQREEAQRQAVADQHYQAESIVRSIASWAYVDGDVNKRVPTEAGKIWLEYVTKAETPDASGAIPIPDMKLRSEWAILKTRERLTELQKKNEAPVRAPEAVKKLSSKPNTKSGSKNSDAGWPKGMSLEKALMGLV